MARAPTTFYQIRKFARRQRGLVAAAGAIALTLVAAAVISTVFAVRADAQRARAEAAQTRAEARFADVRALANTFLFDMHDLIAPLAGSIEARQKLVATGLTYLDSLATEAQDDPELLDELAEAYFRIGDIQGNPRRSNLGDVAAALASYDRSVELRQRLAEVDPSVGRQVKLMLTRIAIGETLTSSERPGDALERFAAARDGLESIRPDHPDNVDVLDAISLAESRMGSALLDMGRLDEALPHFEACLALAERVAELEPTDTMRRRVTIALNEVGRTLGRMGRHDEALPHYERSMAIRAAAAAAAPENARAQRDLALVHHRLSDVHRDAGDTAAALREAGSAHAILQRIADAAPSEARARFDLAVAEHKLAEIFEAAGRPAEAFERFEASHGLMVALSAENPDNLFYATSTLLPRERAAHCLRLLERHEEARSTYREVIAMAEAIHASSTTDVRPWTALASAQRGIGLSLLAQAEAADPASAGALRQEAGGWFTSCLETIAAMERIEMVPTRSSLNREDVRALLAECDPAAAATAAPEQTTGAVQPSTDH